MQLAAAVALLIEEDTYEIGYWKFKDRSLHIGKAIRIPYIYIDENGKTVLAHILVGYEGEGGGIVSYPAGRGRWPFESRRTCPHGVVLLMM
jgi:hypothetical protein